MLEGAHLNLLPIPFNGLLSQCSLTWVPRLSSSHQIVKVKWIQPWLEHEWEAPKEAQVSHTIASHLCSLLALKTPHGCLSWVQLDISLLTYICTSMFLFTWHKWCGKSVTHKFLISHRCAKLNSLN